MKSENELITRRATVDDIPELVRLWDNFSYPSDIFEKRLTEFHLVEHPHSKQILAAIGVFIVKPLETILTQISIAICSGPDF